MGGRSPRGAWSGPHPHDALHSSRCLDPHQGPSRTPTTGAKGPAGPLLSGQRQRAAETILPAGSSPKTSTRPHHTLPTSQSPRERAPLGRPGSPGSVCLVNLPQLGPVLAAMTLASPTGGASTCIAPGDTSSPAWGPRPPAQNTACLGPMLQSVQLPTHPLKESFLGPGGWGPGPTWPGADGGWCAHTLSPGLIKELAGLGHSLVGARATHSRCQMRKRRQDKHHWPSKILAPGRGWGGGSWARACLC